MTAAAMTEFGLISLTHACALIIGLKWRRARLPVGSRTAATYPAKPAERRFVLMSTRSSFGRRLRWRDRLPHNQQLIDLHIVELLHASAGPTDLHEFDLFLGA